MDTTGPLERAGYSAGREATASRISELEAALRGILPFTHAEEQRVFLRKGIGTETPSGRAWQAVFAALGEPVKRKKS